MGCDTCMFRAFFEDPFWVGLYERWVEDGYSVCKLTFGAEPKDHQIYETLLARWRELRFSPALSVERSEKTRISPRRVRREVAKVLSGPACRNQGPGGYKAPMGGRERNSSEKEP